MTKVIRRSMSYTQGVGRSTSFRLTLPGLYGPRCITVCESCGQSHDQTKNHLYDYPVEVDDDLQCQVCLQPLVDPVDTPCGHTFCYICMMEHLRRNQACPCDRQPLCEREIKSSSLIVRRILDKLRVVCPNTAYCDATMPRSSLERHLRLNCSGTYVHCPREREGCRHVGPRIQLEEHLWTCAYGEDKDRRTGKLLPITEGCICIVEIPKGDSDLGLIVSQCERTGAIVVEDIFVEGNVFRDGRLMPGDRILEIDNHDFTTKSLAQARLALVCINPLVRLTVLRNPHQDYDASNVELIELVKDDHRPLGIQIHTYKNRSGIYVYHLVVGSLADECGCINIGDRILEANGYDIRCSTIDEAATIMAKAEGVVSLLVAHRQRLSSGSDTSSRSNHSNHSMMSVHSERSHKFVTLPRSDRSSSRSMLARHQRVYEEILAPSGYAIGSGKCIIIKKRPDACIGMSVSGGIDSNYEGVELPVFVSAITPCSAADLCGKIQRGDIIMSINGTSLTNKTHNEAVEIMKSLSTTNIVRLELIQGEELFEEDGGVSPDWRVWMERYSIERKNPLEYSITLSRNYNSSLGFSIVGGVCSRRGDSPIYVKGIAPKSITASDGRLQCRDQIMSINNISTAGKTQSQVVDIIKSSTCDLTLSIIPHDTYC